MFSKIDFISMKKNFILLVVCSLSLVSCLDGYYDATDNPVVAFGFTDNNKDSLFFGPSFLSSYFGYMNSAEDIKNEASRLQGGFGMSSRIIRWTLPDNSQSGVNGTVGNGRDSISE